jgi:hypothetical protein
MKKTMILATALALGLSAPAWAQHRDHRSGPFLQQGTVGMGGTGTNRMTRDRDINRRLPNARNSQNGGRPNNPNLGPVDSSGNSPSDNR